ncbi:hypothetical protein KAW18_09295 [candidate division WOR-3 bacterium]|nr:hypothetical protein [candidate division WOR-3 bacterium]
MKIKTSKIRDILQSDTLPKKDCINLKSIEDINKQFKYEDTVPRGKGDSKLLSCGQKGSYNELHVGAHFLCGGKDVKVWKTELKKNTPWRYENIEPGKILEIEETKIIVKCGEGLLQLIEHNCSLLLRAGDYL